MSSCSNDEAEPEKPVVVVPEDPKPTPTGPILPKSELMKPAIVNTNSTVKKTAKGTAELKRVVRSIWFPQNYMGVFYNYHLNMERSEYLNLPSENLYDSAEVELNKETARNFELEYKYNALGQLTEIVTGKVYTNNGFKSNPENFNFEYNADGVLNKMVSSYLYGGTFTYNSKGLIDKKIEQNGFVSYEYSYDDLDRIQSVYFYMMTPNGRQPHMHYTYIYLDDRNYVKNWLSINPTDQTETLTSYVTYTFDPTKAGVYNKEPYYRIDNSYLHVVKINSQILYNGTWQLQFESVPKYFYDTDGYLIKYDAAGFNYTQDITVFEYE
ncbi:hypothetical protein HYN86_02915 [Flavobacterium fluviale]|uniref:YD repeat-containing protein n=2 Tax=Flavobacterium fluviale TaxID=2249356 RepID=A0A344LNW7_9FLAO|nr:hypothetical protein HYN86_02915 [Flavobacterium fluviale]